MCLGPGTKIGSTALSNGVHRRSDPEMRVQKWTEAASKTPKMHETPMLVRSATVRLIAWVLLEDAAATNNNIRKKYHYTFRF